MATANSHADAGAGGRQPAKKILIQQRSAGAGAGTRSTNDGVRREVAAVKDA